MCSTGTGAPGWWPAPGLPAEVEAAGGIAVELCARAMAARAAVVRNDLAVATDADSALARAHGLTAYACIPLLVGSNVLGALAVGTRQGSLDEEAVDLVRTIVDYLAVAEQRLQAEDELRRVNETLETAVAARTRELEEQERQLRAVVEASFQAVWSADDGGRIRHPTPAWEIDGAWRREWSTDGWIAAVHPAEQVDTAAAWDRAVRERTPLEIDVRLGAGESGPWRWATVRAVPLDRPDGTPGGWAGTILDIDERTRADLQLRTLAADLARAEARERQRIAEVLHDDLQQLLYGAQMRLGMLREHLADGQVEAAVAQADDADRFIDDGVALARHLSSDLAPHTLRETDLGETVRWLADQMRDRHGLEVEVDLDGPLDVSDTDLRLVLYQCLQELLFNVVKHADARSAALSARGSAGGALVLTVTDHGQGFDPAAEAGDGQGLANVARRLGLVGASLDLRSIPGDGTTATISVPAQS
ncbi:MAG: GAF domain-containing protein [Acidimicrobiales bacterium]